MPKISSLFPFFLLFLLFGCNNNDPKKEKPVPPPNARLSFDSIIGIRYHEVKRRFSSGLSFNEMGFQQEPTWIIEFKSNDTVLAYSPVKKKMQPFFLLYDHGNVYNFAKEYFRIKKISKDSLVFQRLQLIKREILKDIRSDVNITYYSKSYIENVLKTKTELLQRPTAADTAYIKSLSAKSNEDPANAKFAFAGRRPVEFTPLSNMIKVKKLSSVDVLNGKTESYDYMFPKYKIEIARAYKDFGYEFTAIVDAWGKIHLLSFGNVLPEDAPARKKTLEAIISVYLSNLLKTRPGTTMGFAHSSEITLIVVGKKG